MFFQQKDAICIAPGPHPKSDEDLEPRLLLGLTCSEVRTLEGLERRRSGTIGTIQGVEG